jgi:DNA repair photolyase
MGIWKEVELITDSGEIKSAIAPVIISASRSTDIAAFHTEWLINRLKSGYVSWINPFRKSDPIYVSFKEARLFVFWTKNPVPLMEYLPFIDELGLNYYFQYTLNDYEKEGFEPNIPSLKHRIKTFKRLSELIGKERVIWRFDPLLLTFNLTVSELLNRISSIGNELVTYTNKLVFSFADILKYRNVKHNLIRETPFYNMSSVSLAEFSFDQKMAFAMGIQKLLEGWIKINPGFKIATCAEDIDLKQYSITHNKCVDDELIAKIFVDDKNLMSFPGFKSKDNLLFGEEVAIKKQRFKDKGQRKDCGCMVSKDIGSYNSCNHLCVYCYANSSPAIVRKNLNVLTNDSERIIR